MSQALLSQMLQDEGLLAPPRQDRGLLAKFLMEGWPGQMAKSAANAVALPGQVAGGMTEVKPEVPGMWSDMDEARQQATANQIESRTKDLAGLLMGGSYTAPRPNGVVLNSGLSDMLYHGSPRAGLTEIAPSSRGPLGPGVYTTPAENVARRYGDEVYDLPQKTRDVFRGHGHRSDSEWYGYKDDVTRLINAAEPENRGAVSKIMERMWSGDGYPAFARLSQLYGGDDAAQALFKRAGFEGLSGMVDGPEVLLFAKQPLK